MPRPSPPVAREKKMAEGRDHKLMILNIQPHPQALNSNMLFSTTVAPRPIASANFQHNPDDPSPGSQAAQFPFPAPCV